jgi:metallophosphoesterase superfamily enzyme
MAYCFLHLSDIHFGQSSGTAAKHDHIRKALLADAKSLAQQRGAPTRILITGDISYSGKHDEFKTAVHWIEQLTAGCGCHETHVCTIPGNHDCDRTAITNQARMVYAQLRAHNSPEMVQASLVEINQDGEPANPFLPKLSAYRQFASAYGCDFGSPSCPSWQHDFDFPSGVKLRLHGLTSVQVSNAEDTLGNIILGNQQYMIAEEDDVINVVLVHHPLHWLKDREEAEKFLHNNARIIMVGHEHVVNIHKTEDQYSNKAWVVIHAGASNPPEGAYGHSYNWIEFSHEERLGAHYLVVEVFPRAWNPDTVRFERDHRKLGATGDSVKIDIACPNIKLGTKQKEPPVQPVGVPAVPVVAESTMLTPKSVTANLLTMPHEVSHMKADSTAFDRLRYLFWHYLDWQQRLKVLVDVDALPKTANQPVPQTLERVALETAAKSSGKLHDLWEAMMPLIPENKRASNPFQPNDRI